MERQQKIIDHLVEACNWYAEANEKAKVARDYLEEMVIELPEDSEEFKVARAVLTRLSFYVSEDVKSLPGDLQYVIDYAKERFGK